MSSKNIGSKRESFKNKMKGRGNRQNANVNRRQWSSQHGRRGSPQKVLRESGDPIEIQLLDLLVKAGQHKVTIHQFLKETKYTKQLINHHLYDMKDKGLLTRTQENPPTWFLLPKGRQKCESLFATPTTVNPNFASPAPFTQGQTRMTLRTRPPSATVTLPGRNAGAHNIDQGPKTMPASFDKNLVGDIGEMVSSIRRSFDDSGIGSKAQIPAPLPPKAQCPPESDEDMLCRQASSINFISPNGSDSSKNAISTLNEFAQTRKLTIEYHFTDEGPAHNKRFFATLILGDQNYQPIEGNSKKDAKLKAAQNALCLLSGKNTPQIPVTTVSTVQSFQAGSPPIISGSKNAVSVINEYAQANRLAIDFDCNIHGPDHKRRFTTTLTVGSRVIAKVEGSSKKESKLKAAEVGNRLLIEEGKMQEMTTQAAMEYSFPCHNWTYHDRVSVLVNQKFESLLSELPDKIVGRKIVAGFVMSRVTQTDIGEERKWTHISVSSGNRCVAGDKLSLKGETVNDCHAEVIARRGLMRFLYRELLSYDTTKETEDCIFTDQRVNNKVSLKDGIEFHLYISTAPCGDSALFAKSDMDDSEEDDNENLHHPLFDSKKQGVLRTKVENGEGCIPIEEDANVPTWDGILKGERLRTMSCSDKLAKWNFLGLQGALLSQFIEPIYMSSLTLGMLYHHGHLTRAVCCRLEKYLKEFQVSVPTSYKVHHPSVAKISGDAPGRDTGKVKTREFSLNWTTGDDKCEVLDGTVGRCEPRFGCLEQVSQVCKARLYAQYKQLSGNQNLKSYTAAKNLSEEYQAAKKIMKEAFYSAGCGKWMNKPVEEDDFT